MLEIQMLCGGIGSIGGLINYLYRLKGGQRFQWGDFFLQLFTAALCGIMFAPLAGSLVGKCIVGLVVGWLNFRLLDWLEEKIINVISG